MIELLYLYPNRSSAEATELTKQIQQVQQQVLEKLRISNAKYKAVADKHRREVYFQEGDLVMAYFKRQRFPAGTFGKLSQKKFGPFRILQRLGTNAYLLDLPPSVGTSPVFNIAELSAYEGESADTVDMEALPLPVGTPLRHDHIDDVMDIRVTQTRHGHHRRFLVRWTGHPLTDCTWINAEEL